MQMEHHFTVPVPVDVAWQALLDPERIAPCMPGATLSSVEGNDFAGSVKVKLGPVTLLYKGTGTFTEVDESARRVVVDASGKDSRGNGTAAATVTASLVEENGTTAVRVDTDLKITGKPAQLGRGMISEVGSKLLGQFASCLAERLAGADVTAAEQKPAAAASDPGPSAEASPAGEASPAAEASPAGEAGASTSAADAGAAGETNAAASAASTSGGEASQSPGGQSPGGQSSGGQSSDESQSSGGESAGTSQSGETSSGDTTAGGASSAPASNGTAATGSNANGERPAAQGRGRAEAERPSWRVTSPGVATGGLRSVGAPNTDSEQGANAAANGSANDSAEAIDLLDTAGTPVLKRVLPVVLGVVSLVVLFRLIRRRRNR